MFTIDRERILTDELLYKMINKFCIGVKPKLEKYKNYYDGIQKIKEKRYSDDSKPCNRSTTNFCKNISDSFCGYLASPGCISYNSNDGIDEVMDILRYNDFEDEDSSLLLDALVYGTAAELMYIDEDAKVRFKLINPMGCFGVFDNSLTNDLLYFVRWYKRDEWTEDGIYNVDVYGDNYVSHYTMSGLNGSLSLNGTEPHYFGQCPANIFFLPDERSIFDCIIDLQDSYNEILTSEIDDYSAFVDAFLCLSGVDAEEDDIQKMRQNRVLVLPGDSTATWLTKNASDAQTENMLKRVSESIYRIASCPDFSSDSFTGGVSSGIALRFRLCGMENRAAKIEALMKRALQRRIEIICGIASLKLGEEVFRDVEIVFKRNIPTDNNDIVNTVNALKGTVSDETLLGMIPLVSDVQAEIRRVQAQKQANIEMYGFGSGGDGDGGDDE